jgi:hypothetical protein
MARIAAAAIVGVAVGTALGAWVFRGKPAAAADSQTISRVELREENERLARSLQQRIDELGSRIDAIAARSAGSSRQTSPSPPAGAVTTEPESKPEALAARLGRLEQRIETMTAALEAHGRVAIYPTAEQLRAARKPADWTEIARLSAAFVGEREAGLSMVRFLTFDEILGRFGPPTTINAQGNWFYERPEGIALGPETIELDFVNGYVVSLHSTDE